jgi:hypothetical protein
MTDQIYQLSFTGVVDGNGLSSTPSTQPSSVVWNAEKPNWLTIICRWFVSYVAASMRNIETKSNKNELETYRIGNVDYRCEECHDPGFWVCQSFHESRRHLNVIPHIDFQWLTVLFSSVCFRLQPGWPLVVGLQTRVPLQWEIWLL